MTDPRSHQDLARWRRDVDDALASCERHRVTQVELQFADISGALKSVYIPARRLGEALRAGEWFDGSALEGAARAVESDMYLRPDPATFSLTEPSASPDRGARVRCEIVTPDGRPYAGDTRAGLRDLLAAAAADGLHYLVAFEVELFLFPADEAAGRPVEDDPSSYFERGRGRSRQVELDLVTALERMGILVSSSHHEVAAGQHELDLPLQAALGAADSLVTLKAAVKELARDRSLEASFMPKPMTDAAGSGLHTHQVLLDPEGSNLFQDPAGPYGLSTLAQRFAAGQLEHAPALCALVAPLVNSYKRLVSGYEAPAAVSWGRRNRSALLRVPEPPSGPMTALDALGTRLELRLPDPSCNPYLALAAMLAAGLDGIERRLELPPPQEELELDYATGAGEITVPTLPRSLGEALVALEGDDVLAAALGSAAIELVRTTKQLEWEEYSRQVTPWEVERYRRRA